MTPVQMVQEWLTAIGEKYDPALRERLLWEEVRELQAAMDDYYAIHDAVGRLDEPSWSGDMKARKALIAIARELIDVAIVAIGTALLRGHGTDRVHFDPSFRAKELDRSMVEYQTYELFRRPGRLQCIVDAAAYYGFGDKLEACVAEVHRANMAKLVCERCEGKGRIFGEDRAYTHECCDCDGTGRRVNRTNDGKIIKPAGWKAPDLGPILFGGGE